MTVNLTRKGKPVILRKTCPKCSSRKFRMLEFPRMMGNFQILAECRKCSFLWGVENGVEKGANE